MNSRTWARPGEIDRTSLAGITPQEARELYRLLQLIRQVELKIEELYPLNEMKTPVHLSLGQEAIAAGVCCALSRDDYVFSNHRSHGHYLAKGGNLKTMLAELHGRETGCARGRGGSMHLVDTSVGLPGSSSIVAGGIPLAVGAALASALRGEGRVAVAFFGDGAVDEGVLYESVNFALLRRLPVLFVCENNFYAVCSPTSNRHTSDQIYRRFVGLGLTGHRVDGTNAATVYKSTRQLVQALRNGQGPAFMECRAYRWRGHAGPGSDIKLGYRTQAELTEWQKRCPVENFKQSLITSGLINQQQINQLNREIQDEIEEALQYARESPLPTGNTVTRWLFSREEE